MANENEEKKKKKKVLPFIIIPLVLLLAGSGILLGVKGKDWFGKQSPNATEGEESVDEPTEPIEEDGNYQLFWNVERDTYAYKSPAGLSSREKNIDDGYYHILFATEGRQVTRRVKDFQVVNRIDNLEVMGLKFDEDGIVIDVVPIEEFTGGYLFHNFFVQSVDTENNKIIVNSSETLMGEAYELDLNGYLSRYFDMSSAAAFVGTSMKIADARPFDRISAILDKEGNIHTVFHVFRNVREKMYWNVERKWNSELLATNRKPDANGVYHILMAEGGQQVEILTKNVNVASGIDSYAAKSCGLKFDEEGYAIDYIAPTAVTHGKSVASWYDVFEINGNSFHAEKTIQAYDTGNTFDLELADDCEIYNVSQNSGFVGEATTLHLYDRVQGYTNQAGKVQVLYIVERRATADMYWNKSRKYDSKTGKTTRKREADGYYHFQVAHNGKLEEVKVRDEETATKMDAVAARSFGLIVENGIVTKFYQPSSIYSSKGSWYDVMTWQNSAHTSFHVKKTIAATDTGTEYDITMAPDCKVYNVTETYNENYGEETTLRIGDRIQGWTDIRGNAKIIYVVTRDATNPLTSHKTAHTCEECGENVTWKPWTSGTSLPTETGHYYLCGNVACAQQNVAENQNVVLCLNGYNIRSTGKRFYATFETGATLAMLDCTGKSRVFSSYDGDMGTTQGALLWARYGSVSIYGGTYDVSNLTIPNFGGAIAGSGGTTVAIYGGTFIGGNCEKSGGTIGIDSGASLILAGGTIQAGRSAIGQGDAISVGKGSSVKISGAPVIKGGSTKLYLASGAQVTLNGITGGSIGVTLADGNGTFSTNYESGAEKYFTSDNADYAVGVSDGKLVIGTTNVTEIKLSATEIEMLNNSEKEITFTVLPADSVVSKLEWTSSNPAVVTVDDEGHITSVSQGEATVTATAPNGVSATLNVKVKGEAIRVTGVALDETEAELYVGNSKTLKANVAPSNATTTRVTWASSDESVLTVSEDGVVTALKEGKATITATTVDGAFTASSEITVSGHAHCICGGECADPAHSCSDVTWKAWTSTNTLPSTAADNNVYYYLANDVHLGTQQMIAANTNIYLCLNGHKVVMDNIQQRLYSTFNEGATLTITDCSPDKTGLLTSSVQVSDKTQQGNIIWVRYGTFNLYGGTLDASGVVTGGTGAAICVDGGRTFNMYGGTVIGGNALTNPGGSVYTNGTVNLYGGTLKNGKAKYGGNVTLNGSSVFNMYGGEITGGASNANGGGGQGGNVAITAGTFTMNGGKITNGTATGNGGGNISLASANAYFKMNGGEVSGGKTDKSGQNMIAFNGTAGGISILGGTVDGGINVNTGWITLGGTAKVDTAGQDITLASGIKVVCSNPKEGASFGLTMAAPGYFTNATSESNAKYFVSDDPEYEVVWDSTGLFLNKIIKVTGVTAEDISVSEGSTVKVTYTVLPLDAFNQKVTFTIADTTVATVADDGTVTGVKEGTTTLTVTTEDGAFTDTVDVNVVSDAIHVTGVSLDKTELTLQYAETGTLTATVTPAGATDQSVTWTSSDETVATVVNGTVSAKKIGSATITAKTNDGGFTATCAVTVKAHTHCLCGGLLEEDETHTCEDVTFTPWTSTTALPSTNGNYFLTADVTMSDQFLQVAGTNITICLNGHTVKSKRVKGRVISAFNNSSILTITDCSEGRKGTIKVAKMDAVDQGTGIWVRNDGAGKTANVVNFYAGTIDASETNNTAQTGVGVQVEAGQTFNMYGGTILGGSAPSYNGGAVKVVGTFNMYGGTIKGGRARYGGNVVLESTATVFNMYGGEITGGISTANNGGGQGGNVAITNGTFNLYGGKITKGTSNGNHGGNISLASANAYFNMYGGEVTGGKTDKNGPNICAFNGTKGSVKIVGGTVDGGVYINNGWITLGGTGNVNTTGQDIILVGGNKVVVSNPEEGARFGITRLDGKGYFTNATAEVNKKYFRSDDGAFSVGWDSTGLHLKDYEHVHCICGGTLTDEVIELSGHVCSDLTWTEWNTTNSLPKTTGNYYLTKDVQLSDQFAIPANVTLNLCLNGYVITGKRAKGRVITCFNANSVLNLCDCSDDQTGAIIAKNAAAQDQGGVVWVRNQGGDKFTLYGGTLDASEYVSTVQTGAGVQIESGGVFEMYGGTILGGTATKGGAVFSAGTFDMYGGTIDGGTSGEGGTLRLHAGTTTMYGGTVKNGVSTASGGNVFVNINTTFIIKGGEILDGSCPNSGGNILLSAVNGYAPSKVIMEGGTISGGSAKSGGNILINAAGNCTSTMKMTGGLITKGTSKANNGGGHGGNVNATGKFYMNGGTISDGFSDGNGGGNVAISMATSYFEMNGGTISGGKSTTANAGGVYVFYQAVADSVFLNGGLITENVGGVLISVANSTKVSGDIQITGNEACDLRLNGTAKLKLGTLKAPATIGITMQTPGTFAENALAADANFFKAFESTTAIAVDVVNQLLQLIVK